MNIFSWLISHIPDFQALFALAAGDISDFPKTSGHGEIIAYFIRHEGDIGQVIALVNKIKADYPATVTGPKGAQSQPMSEAAFREGLNKHLAANPQLGGGGLIKWLMANLPAIIAFLKSIGVLAAL